MNKVLLREKKVVLSSILAFALSACAMQADKIEKAFLPADSQQARTEIIELISKSLGGKNVPIAANVFQESNRLLIGTAPVTSPQGIKIVNADQKLAIIFELVKQGENCLLQRINTTQKWQLKTKRCFTP